MRRRGKLRVNCLADLFILKKLAEFFRSQSSLAEDRVQDGGIQIFRMDGNSYQEMAFSQLQMTAGLTHGMEAASLKRSNDCSRLEDGESRHARGWQNQP